MREQLVDIVSYFIEWIELQNFPVVPIVFKNSVTMSDQELYVRSNGLILATILLVSVVTF